MKLASELSARRRKRAISSSMQSGDASGRPSRANRTSCKVALKSSISFRAVSTYAGGESRRPHIRDTVDPANDAAPIKVIILAVRPATSILTTIISDRWQCRRCPESVAQMISDTRCYQRSFLVSRAIVEKAEVLKTEKKTDRRVDAALKSDRVYKEAEHSTPCDVAGVPAGGVTAPLRLLPPWFPNILTAVK